MGILNRLNKATHIHTCQIKQITLTSDPNTLKQHKTSVVVTGGDLVKCRLIESVSTRPNESGSPTFEKYFNLSLEVSFPIKDDYIFTNFKGEGLRHPSTAIFKIMDKTAVTPIGNVLNSKYSGITIIDKLVLEVNNA